MRRKVDRRIVHFYGRFGYIRMIAPQRQLQTSVYNVHEFQYTGQTYGRSRKENTYV